MTISVNNTSMELDIPENITGLLRRLAFHQTRGLAVAVNNLVVSKSEWETHMLNEHDKVIIIRATQGG